MALKAKYQTSPFVFTGNPIILESEGYPTDMIKGGKFIITFEGKRIYEGRFFPPLNIDISEIVDAASEFLPEPSGKNFYPWELIEVVDPEALNSKRKLSVYVDYNGNDDETYEMLALPGGIPTQQFRMYAKGGKDVFDSRLYGQDCNLFFTNRTNGWRIEMKETELYPLYFLASTHSMRIRVRDSISGNELGYEVPGGICTLDPAALRREMLANTHKLGSVFDIYLDHGGGVGFGCQLVIKHCDPAKERYRLKFRNSFGVFEIMEITGKLIENREFPESEESSYRKFDPVTRRFSNLRRRLDATRSFSITTPLERGQGEFVADLLASEEIYILDAFDSPVRVNVTSEEFSWQKLQETPESISFKIELTDPDHFFGEVIAGITDGRKPRIHSDEFTNEFN